jgi:nucleoside-diphosphate-sugar epimerase
MTSRTALVVGATGIVGLNLATLLADQSDWQVYGLARNPKPGKGVRAVAADLLKPDTLRDALAGIEPTHVFLTTWMRQPTEAENIKINATMVRNVLDALSSAASVQPSRNCANSASFRDAVSVLDRDLDRTCVAVYGATAPAL